MNLYLDSSAIVKRYVEEKGSDEVAELLAEVATVGTSWISFAETSAAIARSHRLGDVSREEATRAVETLREDWQYYSRVPVSSVLIERAGRIACTRELRGYDAVQLASALVWSESLRGEVGLVTYDLELWSVIGEENLERYPKDLPALIESWNQG